MFAAFQRDTAFWYGYAYKSLEETSRSFKSPRATNTTRAAAAKRREPPPSGWHEGGGQKGGGQKGGRKGLTLPYSEEAPSPLRRDESVSSMTSVSSVLASMDQTSDNDIRVPLVGLSLPDHALEGIAEGLDTLHRSDIVSFAELSLHVSTLLGAGGLAKVFPGTFRRRRVAFKIMFTPVITKETIQSFFLEASLLRSCTHPNVVELLGVCVAPPSMTLILELCDRSLYEELQERRVARSAHREFVVEMRRSEDTGRENQEKKKKKKRRKEEVEEVEEGEEGEEDGEGEEGEEDEEEEGEEEDRQHQLFFETAAYQCVRAVAYLHSKRILHRDIKSLNFLVGKRRRRFRNNFDDNGRTGSGGGPQFVVKLTDMDLAKFETEADQASVRLQEYEYRMEEWVRSKLEQWENDEGYRLSRISQCPTKLEFESYLRQKVKIKLVREREREEERREESKHSNSSSLDWSHRSLNWSSQRQPEEEKKKNKKEEERKTQATDNVVGTPNWCSPEVLAGRNNTRASDVYALGVVLWECMTLESPHEGKSYHEIVKIVGGGDGGSGGGGGGGGGGGMPLERMKRRAERKGGRDGVVQMSVLTMLERCWSVPSERPTGEELQTYFDDYCNAGSVE
jgi:serine/threonine protein kinase